MIDPLAVYMIGAALTWIVVILLIIAGILHTATPSTIAVAAAIWPITLVLAAVMLAGLGIDRAMRSVERTRAAKMSRRPTMADIDALIERLREIGTDRTHTDIADDIAMAAGAIQGLEVRALTAEHQRDEARAALIPFVEAYRAVPSRPDAPLRDRVGRIHFEAAARIVGETGW